MSINLEKWLQDFLEAMQAAFGHRLAFVGLQGSRGRGEANADSDIDVVVILDALVAADLEAYRQAVSHLPHREKLCGFVSGWPELAAWDKAELFQFCRDTRPLLGEMDGILSGVSREDIRRAVHTGACGIYHGCCHNALHGRDAGALQALYKSAFFALQAKYFLDAGEYISRRTALAARLKGADAAVLGAYLERMGRAEAWEADFDACTAQLLEWASGLICEFCP